jgi:hypothetical protein
MSQKEEFIITSALRTSGPASPFFPEGEIVSGKLFLATISIVLFLGSKFVSCEHKNDPFFTR